MEADDQLTVCILGRFKFYHTMPTFIVLPLNRFLKLCSIVLLLLINEVAIFEIILW